jgi:hypothetical protein
VRGFADGLLAKYRTLEAIVPRRFSLFQGVTLDMSDSPEEFAVGGSRS